MKQWHGFWDSAVAVDLGHMPLSQLLSDYILKGNLKKN